MPDKNGWFQIEALPKARQQKSAAIQKHRRGHYLQKPYIPRNFTGYEPEPYRATPMNITENKPGKTVHAQTAGENGPILLQDSILRETLAEFIHASVLDRAVYAKGYGALGYFQATHSMREYTTASLFQAAGAVTPVSTRFALAFGPRGAADTRRNLRGFSVKFFVETGVYDLLCNHIPVSMVHEPIKYPEAVKAFSPSPVTNLYEPDKLWRFFAATPEMANFLLWLYTDLGTKKSFRTTRFYGVNTYVWKNIDGKRTYVKYHWIPTIGEETITRQEASRLAGTDPDIAGHDLHRAIASGDTPAYGLYVQLLDPNDLLHLSFDPLDSTKLWDESAYPLKPVGRLVLDHNPETPGETEQLAFSPSNLIEGIELSADRILQGSSAIYADAQRRRLGPDFRKLSANGQSTWSPQSQISSGAGQYIEGYIQRAGQSRRDNFSQAGKTYKELSPAAQENLIDNLAADLALASVACQQKALEYFGNASPILCERLRQRIRNYS